MSDFDFLPRGHDLHSIAAKATANWNHLYHLDDREQYRPGDQFWIGRTLSGVPFGWMDDRHLLTVAGTRGGKGVGPIMNTLLEWKGDILITDPKGENADLTAAYRAEVLGHNVMVFDAFGVTTTAAKYRKNWNPLDTIDITKPTCISRASSLADAIVTNTGQHGTHWDESARFLIKGFILYACAHLPPERKTMRQVRAMIVSGDQGEGSNGIASLLGDMISSDQAYGAIQETGRFILDRINEEGEITPELNSIISTAMRNLEIFSDPLIDDALKTSDFNFDMFHDSDRPTTLYLVMPVTKISNYGKLLKFFIDELVAHFESRGLWPRDRPQVLMMLDEFAQLGRLDKLRLAMPYMAGLGLKIWPFVQSLAQLKRIYREDWEVFYSSTGLRQFFAVDDAFTLDYVSRALGTTQFSQINYSLNETTTTGEGNASLAQIIPHRLDKKSIARAAIIGSMGGYKSESEGKSLQKTQSVSYQTGPLLTPDEIKDLFSRMSNRQLCLLADSRAGIILNRTPYYDDPYFKNRL